MTWTKELDEAAELATKKGCWHTLLFYLLCGLAAIPTSFLVFSQVFTNATPEHWCAPHPDLAVLGLPAAELRSITIPRAANDLSFENCLMYDLDPLLEGYLDVSSPVLKGVADNKAFELLLLKENEAVTQEKSHMWKALKSLQTRNTTARCRFGWHYEKEHYARTLVTDFNLVCDQDWWPRTSNTLFWVGSIFGNVFFGWMSDRYGRRPTILLMIVLEVPLSLATAFIGDYMTYTILRVAGGLFFPALYQVPFILALELMPPNKRTYAGIVVSMLFAGGMCILALMAYALRDWFTLTLATSLPFIFLFSYYWLIPESPRWLVGRGRIAEAEKIYRNLARNNDINLPHGFLLELHKKVKEKEDIADEAVMLETINGQISNLLEENDKQLVKYPDRRISNMLTFKSSFTKVSETEEPNKSPDLERIISLEDTEVVNKKSRCKDKSDSNKQAVNTTQENTEIESEKENDKNTDEESHLNSSQQEKSTQTELYNKTSDTIRRKSQQIVKKVLGRKRSDIDLEENRKMDDQNSEGDCKATPLDLFRYPNIRKKFFILTFDWITLGVVYNSLSYNSSNLGVDDYLAFFIGGAVEIPSYFLAWSCMDKFGRRWVLCIFMCVGGVACLCCVLVPDAWPWVTVTLAMLGRLCAAASFGVFYVLIGELLPTVLRSQAMGIASFIAGLGLLACPYIVHLAIYSRSLPLSIMGILSIAGGGTSLFLPETLHQPLPQTISDGELFKRQLKVERPRSNR